MLAQPALIACVGLALAQPLLPPTESALTRKPALVGDWADRLLAADATIRATAEAALVQGAQRSFPLLRRFLDPEHEDLHAVTFRIIQRIGPPAIPLLVDLLRHESDSVRRSAVDELIDLAPHTEGIQPALRRALTDADSVVAGDAARALGALGRKAGPSVGALAGALSSADPYVRIYVAEALASIGPKAARATMALASALDDPVPGVRWAACEALGSIGPAAAPAVPRLIEALSDEFLFVRLFAAGALGGIGPNARAAREALGAAASDPALRDEAEWALRRIDTQGFRDGENDGPYREERFQDDAAADIVWELDMCGRLGVFPHEATNSEVLPVGELLIVSTSNGQNEGHTRVPSPRAPSLIAVEKRTGEVVWSAVGPGEQVLHGQWSSPVVADVDGRTPLRETVCCTWATWAGPFTAWTRRPAPASGSTRRTRRSGGACSWPATGSTSATSKAA